MSHWPTYVGTFHQVSIYETRWMGSDLRSAGLCLPGIGVLVGDGVYSRRTNLSLVMHEYGHILQFRRVGWWRFYLIIGLSSLLSAVSNGFGRGHMSYWTEYWANHLAKSFFGPAVWTEWRYPAKDITDRTKKWLLP
ncbi:MAG: hypothetical protein AAFR14_01190 [Bacteroidota bacterium]